MKKNFIGLVADKINLKIIELLKQRISSVDPTIDWSLVEFDVDIKAGRADILCSDEETKEKLAKAKSMFKSPETGDSEPEAQ